ncbi:MAG: YciI family protein [Aestuariibaculum sp.]
MERLKYSIATISILLLFIACKDAAKSLDVNTEIEEKPKEIIVDTVIEVKQEPIKTTAEIKTELAAKGYTTFDYIDAKTQDTILIQQYFMVFLKNGPIRSQNEEESQLLQEAHLAHLSKMYELGYADISGPMGDEGEIRGISIYNVPTLKMADSLAKTDPAVKAGRLVVEVHPWWAAKGFPLR